MNNSKFVGLIILDGFGLRQDTYGNAVKIANPQKLFNYFKKYSFTTLEASGTSVGLPAGQIGNSEVGHLNIGAGRVVYQPLLQINKDIESGVFAKNKVLVDSINYAKQNNKAIHIMGLLSDGGVHSHINHLFAICDLVKQYDVRAYIHIITDGRDTYRDSANKYVDMLKSHIVGTNIQIATICGRYYAMDRESNFDRIEEAYKNMILHTGHKLDSADEISKYLSDSYSKNIFDEFIEPAYISGDNNLSNGDVVIFYNYREDRARQITRAMVEDNFDKFPRLVKDLYMVTMTQYDDTFTHTHVMYQKVHIDDNLSHILSDNGCKQFKISETTKYAHVTFFLNGGIEKPYPNEDRFLIETIKAKSFDMYPKMRAFEITNTAIDKLLTKKYNFMALNYSNCDMLGHTGNLDATVEAIKFLDGEVDRLIKAILSIGGVAIICADHGNCEDMLDSSGRLLTDHTTNPVPFCIVDDSNSYELSAGALCNVAPTILDLLGIKKPKAFSADSLIIKRQKAK